MTHLKRVYCAHRLLHSSPHWRLQCSPALETKGNDSSKTFEDNGPESRAGNKTTSVSEDKSKENLTAANKSEINLPDEPTTCCMSGCANCVWIEYAEELCKVLEDGEKAREVVLSKVTDPNMRAFLLMELNHLKNNGANS